MKSIIDQNNETLAFLRDQDFSSAVASAYRVLECHRLLCPGDISCDTKDPSGSLDQCMLLSKLDACDTETSPAGFIYRYGIMLQPTMTDTAVITAALIFNSALAHHLLALQLHQYESLHKARRLYVLASNAHDMEHNILFQFAVINNVLMIDRQVAGHDANVSIDCLEHLISLFMIMVDQGCDMHLRHVDGFLMNLPSNAQTAAAA